MSKNPNFWHLILLNPRIKIFPKYGTALKWCPLLPCTIMQKIRNFEWPVSEKMSILGNSNPPFRKGGLSYVPSIFICKKWKTFNDHFTSIWLKTLYSWQSILIFRLRLFYEITSYLKNSHYYLLLACKK